MNILVTNHFRFEVRELITAAPSITNLSLCNFELHPLELTFILQNSSLGEWPYLENPMLLTLVISTIIQFVDYDRLIALSTYCYLSNYHIVFKGCMWLCKRKVIEKR